jgi:hypothetical protein
MAKQRPVDKPCVDCGVLMVGVAPMRQRCPECIEKRNRKLKKKNRGKKNREEMVEGRGSPIINPYAKFCKGCDYWGSSYGYDCCNYQFIEGKLRMCPAGEGCPFRKTEKKGRKQ